LAYECQLAGHPTPNANEPDGDLRPKQDRITRDLSLPGNWRQQLGRTSHLAGHPTPNTPNGGRTVADTMSMDATGKTADGAKHTASLEHCAKLAGHPTPNCPTGGPNSNRENRGAGGADLEEVANLAGHPTCAAALANPGQTTASTDTSTAKTAGYRLNPGFSLWLMIGIPTIVDVWASCGVRGMELFRRSRRSS
jgi:hypothetical protein